MNLEKNGERNESLHRRALQTIQQPIVDLADDHRGQRGMSCVRALSTPVLPRADWRSAGIFKWWLWLDGSFELIVCPLLLAELERALLRPKFRPYVTVHANLMREF